jgi:hypothetical protein
LDTKDGGALAMKTYGNLRREHSIAQAQRVSFLGRDTADAYSRDGSPGHCSGNEKLSTFLELERVTGVSIGEKR